MLFIGDEAGKVTV
jgi:hypothetical protein